MPLSKFFPLLILTLSLFHHIVSASGEDLVHICLDSGNYTTNEPYDKNLKELLIYLTIEAPTSGFAMASKGEGTNRTHRLAFCRGDLFAQDCWNYIVHASNDMLTSCPNNKGATMFHENYNMRYSNEDFFGQTMNTSLFCWRPQRKMMNGSNSMMFGQRVQDFLTQVFQEVVLHPKMYASGMLELDEFHTAYGLAQCSRDLSSMDCMKCLNESLLFLALPQCGQERVGVRVYSESCRVRYELYPFLSDHSHYPIPVPFPPSNVPNVVSPHLTPTSSSHGIDVGIFIGLPSLLLINLSCYLSIYRWQ